MCTVHHLNALIDGTHFSDAACLLHPCSPSSRLGSSIAAAVGDPIGAANIRTAMDARLDKWGTIGRDDLVLVRDDAGYDIKFGRIEVLFEQINAMTLGPMCIFCKHVVDSSCSRSWRLRGTDEAFVVPVRAIACPFAWTVQARSLMALKPDFMQVRIG